MLKLLKNLFLLSTPVWQDVERFDSTWRTRIETMSSFVMLEDASVVDVGCGPMWLRDYLRTDIKYIGIDYVYRGDDMVVVDLNKEEIPTIPADVWFVSGCLEYINDVESFIGHVARNAKTCILSYCDVKNFSSIPERQRRGWRNHLASDQIIDLFSRHRMRMTHSEILKSKDSIYVFRR